MGEDANYSVTANDTFTESGKFEKDNLEYKTYYLKVRAIDYAGNLSNVVTHKVTNSKPTPVDYKMEKIKNMFVKNGVSDSLINKYANYIYNYIPNHMLDEVINHNVKIYLVSSNLREYAKNNYGVDAGFDMLGFYINEPYYHLVLKQNTNLNVTLHEFAHAYDYSSSYTYLRSELTDFLNIYNEEGTALFGAGSYFLNDEQEYYAEAFYTYLTNKEKLKSRAPKTYEYFKGVFGQ